MDPSAARPSRATVLLVDDDARVTDALARALRHEPFRVLTASSAERGLELLDRYAVDVVVSDERMPGMSGSAFVSAVRAAYPDTARMIISGQAALEDAVRAINDGHICRFFIKPVDSEELMAAICEAVRDRDRAARARWLVEREERETAAAKSPAADALTLVDLAGDGPGNHLVDADGIDLDAIHERITAEMGTLRLRVGRKG